MSTLHHESILETCFDEAWESFRVHNKLTVEMMEELCSFSKGTVDAIERQAQKLFDERCQQARSRPGNDVKLSPSIYFLHQMTQFHSHADDWSARDLLINAIDKGSANGQQALDFIDQLLNADDVYMGIDSNDDTTFVFSGVR